jgi:hypothetical protein
MNFKHTEEQEVVHVEWGISLQTSWPLAVFEIAITVFERPFDLPVKKICGFQYARFV